MSIDEPQLWTVLTEPWCGGVGLPATCYCRSSSPNRWRMSTAVEHRLTGDGLPNTARQAVRRSRSAVVYVRVVVPPPPMWVG